VIRHADGAPSHVARRRSDAAIEREILDHGSPDGAGARTA
jgi:hypothetical protein